MFNYARARLTLDRRFSLILRRLNFRYPRRQIIHVSPNQNAPKISINVPAALSGTLETFRRGQLYCIYDYDVITDDNLFLFIYVNTCAWIPHDNGQHLRAKSKNYKKENQI